MFSALRKGLANKSSSMVFTRMNSEFAGSQSHGNLVEAFKAASMARARYNYFAEIADIEGQIETAAIFRGLAQAEESIAKSHMEFLTDHASDPQTGSLLGSTEENVQSALEGAKHAAKEMYPGMASVARSEGFEELATEFDYLAEAQKRFIKSLNKAAASV